ncbi:MAG: D-2-hydroxyacid dehydrogenase [Ruminococcaceae bacterium]|nr:D-2-hydroxyacid dehydrogenase [Oscillospiraceae bacterium]
MSLNIVLTDCNTVTSGDLDLSVLEKFGNVTYYGESLPEEIPQRIKDADIVILNKTVLGENELKHAKRLKLIALFATGYNNIDVAYARKMGISVANAGSYSTSSVAQQVFGFILAHATRISEYDRDVKDGAWIRSRLFCFFARPASELKGKTLGIFGYGAIGRRVAEIARAFEMNVIATTRTPKDDDIATFVDFDTLLRESDYLSVNCPLNDGTRELFDADVFAKMKKGAYFINTARGGVICEQALFDALESEHLSGAGIDVLTLEPMRDDCVLKNAKNITITPHIAWAPIETRERLLGIVMDNIESFLNGIPKHIVN